MRKKLSVLALSLVACSGETLDVGSNTGGSGGTGGTSSDMPQGGGTGGTGSAVSGPELPDWSTFESCPVTGESNAAYVGIWDGGIEDFFLNPLTRIRLEITAASLDGVCGKLTWGFGTDPPPPLTDPNETGAAYGVGGYSGTKLHEGVTYTILEGAAREDTLRLGISQAEFWRGFCEAQEQTYYHSSDASWRCIEPYSNIGWATDGASTCSIETSHGAVTHPMKVCSGCGFSTCTCNSAGCTVGTDQRNLFDFALEGSSNDVLTMPWHPDLALGAAVVAASSETIRLTRTE